MLTAVLRTTILMVATLAGCLQAGTPDDIRILETGKTGRSAPAMDSFSLPGNGVATTTDRNVQSTSPVWYSLSDNRKVKVQDWKMVLFMQSTCPYCRQFTPVLKVFSQKMGSDVLSIGLDEKDDAGFPDVFPATPDVMVEYFQSSLPVAMSATFLTNVNTMETWSLSQGAAEVGEFHSRFNEMLRMALDRQSGKSIPLNVQGQQ